MFFFYLGTEFQGFVNLKILKFHVSYLRRVIKNIMAHMYLILNYKNVKY